MSYGGGQVEGVVGERTIKRMVESAGEIWCVPWTGLDASGKYTCPGFEQTDDGGLFCWVIPKPVIQAYKLNPIVVNLTINGYDATNADPGDPNVIRALWMKELLNKYLRRVKISGFETEWAYHPNNEEYLVRVYGPWARVRSGDPIAKRDLSGRRFLKARGVPPGTNDAEIAASKVPTGGARADAADPASSTNDPGSGRSNSNPVSPPSSTTVPAIPGSKAAAVSAANIKAAATKAAAPKTSAAGLPARGAHALQQACSGHL